MVITTFIIISSIVVILAITSYYLIKKNQNKGSNNNECKNGDMGCLLMNNLVMLSSQKESYVQQGKRVLLDRGSEGLNFIVLKRDKLLTLRHKISFDLGNIKNCPCEVDKVDSFIKKYIGNDDFVIVISMGETFDLLVKLTARHPKYMSKLVSALKILGSETINFYENSNYILVGSKKKDIYFESVSDSPILFPYIKIKNSDCRVNTYAIKPPKDYVFFKDYRSLDEMRRRCALEAYKRGHRQFGIGTNVCIPMSNDEYINIFKKFDKSSKCIEDVGAFNAITSFEIEPLTTTKQIYGDIYGDQRNGVIVFTKPNFKGLSTVLNIGTYTDSLNGGIDSIHKVGSLVIPKNFIVYFVDKHKKTITFYGPIIIKNLSLYLEKGYTPTEIKITLIRPGDTLFCENKNEDGSGRCYSFGKGSHTVSGYLFMKLKMVKVGKDVNKVKLFTDPFFLNLHQEIDSSKDGHTVRVEFPRIIRSVIVE